MPGRSRSAAAGYGSRMCVFDYDPRRPILKGVSFDIPAGHKVAVVGPSGSGKSTLVRLLFRFYEVDRRRDHHRRPGRARRQQLSLRRAIGVVPQDTVLFNDTVAANIAYGRPGASQAEIEAAARVAQIHDFILSLPDGYATMVGERGLKLSGGEKQRVAIARVMLKNPPVLVLDEATSALDSRTEQALQEALERIAIGRTTLVIAHRLSTVIDAEEIIVLEQGQRDRARHPCPAPGAARPLCRDVVPPAGEPGSCRGRVKLGPRSAQRPQFIASRIGEILQGVDADTAFDLLV